MPKLAQPVSSVVLVMRVTLHRNQSVDVSSTVPLTLILCVAAMDRPTLTSVIYGRVDVSTDRLFIKLTREPATVRFFQFPVSLFFVFCFLRGGGLLIRACDIRDL